MACLLDKKKRSNQDKMGCGSSVPVAPEEQTTSKKGPPKIVVGQATNEAQGSSPVVENLDSG
jgi:hypothetical protein